MKKQKILIVVGIIVSIVGLLEYVKAAEPGNSAQPRTSITQQATDNGKYARPSDKDLRSRLTPLQYDVTQNEGTERAFSNDYWDNKRAGIYVDITSGQPLFSSLDKFKSGTGWPSFTRAISATAVSEQSDTRFFMRRTELKSSIAQAHLGHLFRDGPKPAGLRYCINSASLRFIPREELAAKGYSEYLPLFGR